MKIFVSGSWDLLHNGHVTFFKEASRYGELYVGIGSDYSIEKYKGHKPICNQEERLFMVRSIRYVKEAYINDGEGQLDFALNDDFIAADIFICNEDQHSEQKENICFDLGIKYIVLERKTLPGLPVRSTTQLRELCK